MKKKTFCQREFVKTTKASKKLQADEAGGRFVDSFD